MMNYPTIKKQSVQQFSRYCSQCNGQCCKRGVFSAFSWEMDQLSKNVSFQNCHIAETRGETKDIMIKEKCVFLGENGCILPINLRTTDCITFPFYPKLKEKNGILEIECLVVHKECPFHAEIAKDKMLVKALRNYWTALIKKVPRQEIIDWIGEDENWKEWYKNTFTLDE